MTKKRNPQGEKNKKRLTTKLEKEVIVELKIQGMTLRQIQTALAERGMNRGIGTIHRRIKEWHEEYYAKNVIDKTEWVSLQLERLEAMFVQHFRAAKLGDVNATIQARGIIQEEIKLLELTRDKSPGDSPDNPLFMSITAIAAEARKVDDSDAFMNEPMPELEAHQSTTLELSEEDYKLLGIGEDGESEE